MCFTVRNCCHFTIKGHIAIPYSYYCERERCLYDNFNQLWLAIWDFYHLVQNSVSLSDYDYRNMYSKASTKEQNIRFLKDGKGVKKNTNLKMLL